MLDFDVLLETVSVYTCQWVSVGVSGEEGAWGEPRVGAGVTGEYCPHWNTPAYRQVGHPQTPAPLPWLLAGVCNVTLFQSTSTHIHVFMYM